MTAITHNEIIKILKDGGIKNAVTLSEDDAKIELMQLFEENFPEDYEAVKDDDDEVIIEAAFAAFSEEDEEDYDEDDDYDEDEESDDEDNDYDEDDAENYDDDSDDEEDYSEDNDKVEDISADPMVKPGEGNTENDSSKEKDGKSGNNDFSDKGSLSTDSGNKSVTETGNNKAGGNRTVDVTSDIANALPSAAVKIINDNLKSRWSEIIKKSNNSRIVAFTIDTPVRDYLKDKKFTVDEKAAQKFLEKWDDKIVEGKHVRKVVDDNEYDEQGKVKKQGENMKNFLEIKKILQGDKTFDVRVTLVKEQKVNGIIIGTLDGKGDEVVEALKNVPVLLVSEYGARIPGEPGVIVNGVGYSEREARTASGQIKKTKKTILLISYKGKGDALSAPDGKFIRQTAEAIPDDEALKLYNKKECDFTAKSDLCVRVNATQETTDDDGNKVIKDVVRTVRLSGKVKVPFFKRKPEYSKLGEVKLKGGVANLTTEDIEKVVEITAAISKTSSAIAAKFEIQNILNGVNKVETNAAADNL